MRILDIARKDWLQLVRDRKTFLFSLVMPALFTLLFGFAFGGFGAGGTSDPRLPVGFLDLDRSRLSRELADVLRQSQVIRLSEDSTQTESGLDGQVLDGALSAAIIVPPGYGHDLLHGKAVRLVWLGDSSQAAVIAAQNDVLAAVIRLENGVRTAVALEDLAGAPFAYSLEQSLARWQDPPVQVIERVSSAIPPDEQSNQGLAHTSPGMMMQFALAGLMVSGGMIVNERKSHCWQRLMTTATRRWHILAGHYLAIFSLTLLQFLLLIAYGQFLLGVNYLRAPLATLLVAIGAALCIAGLGLLVGALARTEEQTYMFAFVPMFVLTGLGGGWVPLEVVGPSMQFIGHLSPVAWAMDGFKSITLRGGGLETAWLPALVLAGYGLIAALAAAIVVRRQDV